MADFTWTQKSEEAAQLIAASRLSLEEIAAKVDVVRSTLWLWRKHPEFAARVDANFKEFREEVRRRGIAIVENRVASLDSRWQKLQAVIDERGADPKLQAVPGGKTGLLVRTVKKIGMGDESELIEEFAVDTGLLKEMREIEKQAAQELGQWVERSNVDQVVKSYEVGNSPDDL